EIEKVKYVSSGIKPENLLSSFRNSYNPRIVVTVDMIATGTDIKPLEIVMFMRAVKSRNFFEQMKGRGVRVIGDDDFQVVTPDAKSKTHFVIVDCVGICEQELSDTYSLERKRNIDFKKLLNAVAYGNRERDVLSSLASRLNRLDHQLSQSDRSALAEVAGGKTLKEITGNIITALDPDRQVEEARRANSLPPDAEPTPEQLTNAARSLLDEAAKPIATNPTWRGR